VPSQNKVNAMADLFPFSPFNGANIVRKLDVVADSRMRKSDNDVDVVFGSSKKFREGDGGFGHGEMLEVGRKGGDSGDPVPGVDQVGKEDV
jgi:hypothetical protein